MKKGFTLVELLAVLIILSVVSLLVFPNVVKIIKQSKQNLYEAQLRDLEVQAKNVTLDHPEILDSNHLNPTYINIETLKKSGYIEMDRVSNPKTEQEMNGCVKISYNDSTSQYTYNYEEINCVADQNLSGYVVTYNNNFEVEKRNEVLSAYDTILANYDGIISTLGGVTDGLYDMGDEYVFRGASPNNYVKLGTNGDSYRIISMDKKNKTIKLIKITPESSSYSSSNSNSFIESNIASYLLSYLSTDNVKNFSSKMVDGAKWNNGILNIGVMNYDILRSVEATSTLSNKLGLINVSDYVIASLSGTCYNNITNADCKNSNYLATLFGSSYVWTIDGSDTGNAITIENGVITKHTLNSTSDTIYRIYPVVIMKKNVSISNGNGTSSSPYIFN